MRKKLFLLILLFLLSISNYCLAFTIEVPLPTEQSLPGYIAYFFQMAMILGGVLAVLSLVFSGIQFIYSAGNPENMSEAKKRAKSAILGLILLLSSFILIKTINPELENLDPTVNLKSTGMLFFAGKNGEKPAPSSLENLDTVKQEYNEIYWKTTTSDLQGRPISNCYSENPNAVYVVYWYRDYNFKNLGWVSRLKCDATPVSLEGANSYLIVKESPGVYFYEGTNCMPPSGSDTIPPPHTQSIPEDVGMGGKNVRSIRIVHGPNPIKGPFFGLVYFNSTDYRTGENNYGYQNFHFKKTLSEDEIFNNNSYCISGSQIGYGNGLPSKGVSWLIYKWVGYKEDGTTTASAGSGITLYTETSWSGGNINFIDAYPSGGSYWGYDLNSTEVYYPENITIPKERRDSCYFFNPVNSCLGSFEIKGNYLVLVLSRYLPSEKTRRYFQDIRVQAFPISPRLQEAYRNRPAGYSVERGTPELETDYIGNKNAYYMIIIPLAERLN